MAETAYKKMSRSSSDVFHEDFESNKDQYKTANVICLVSQSVTKFFANDNTDER